MPLNLIWLEQATHPVVLKAGDAAAEPALRCFDLAGSLGHGHAREEWWADKLVVPPLELLSVFGGLDAPSAARPCHLRFPLALLNRRAFAPSRGKGKMPQSGICRQAAHAKQAGSRRSFADSSGLAIGRRQWFCRELGEEVCKALLANLP